MRTTFVFIMASEKTHVLVHEYFPVLQEEKPEPGDILESFQTWLCTIHDPCFKITFIIESYSNNSSRPRLTEYKLLLKDVATGLHYRIPDDSMDYLHAHLVDKHRYKCYINPQNRARSLLKAFGIPSAKMLSAEENEAYHDGRINISEYCGQERFYSSPLILLHKKSAHFYVYTEYPEKYPGISFCVISP